MAMASAYQFSLQGPETLTTRTRSHMIMNGARDPTRCIWRHRRSIGARRLPAVLGSSVRRARPPGLSPGAARGPARARGWPAGRRGSGAHATESTAARGRAPKNEQTIDTRLQRRGWRGWGTRGAGQRLLTSRTSRCWSSVGAVSSKPPPPPHLSPIPPTSIRPHASSGPRTSSSRVASRRERASERIIISMRVPSRRWLVSSSHEILSLSSPSCMTCGPAA